MQEKQVVYIYSKHKGFIMYIKLTIAFVCMPLLVLACEGGRGKKRVSVRDEQGSLHKQQVTAAHVLRQRTMLDDTAQAVCIDKGKEIVSHNEPLFPHAAAFQKLLQTERYKKIALEAVLVNASAEGDLDTVKALAEMAVAYDAIQSLESFLPVHFAARNGHLPVVDHLLTLGFSVNAVDESGRTPLHYAAESGSVELMNFLIGKDADEEVRDRDGQTPGDIAVELHGHVREDLIDDQNAAQATCPCSSSSSDWLTQADVPEEFVAILQAVLGGKQCIRKLNNLLLRRSQKDTHVDFIPVLVKLGANLEAGNSKGKTPLFIACQRGAVAAAERLLDLGAQVNTTVCNGATPLHAACERKGNAGLVKVLVERGADIEAQDNIGWTPLHYASESGRADSAELLLTLGANRDAVAHDFMTPLQTAAYYGRFDVAKRLLDAGADIGAVDIHGWNALHHACRKGRVEIAKLLVSRGVDKNALEQSRATPGMVAAMHGHIEVTESLDNITN